MAGVALDNEGIQDNRREESAPPFVLVEGVPNFRDLGGLECLLEGKPSANASQRQKYCIRPGYVYRSAQPTQITPAGVKRLTAELEVLHEFDLRSTKELSVVEKRYPGVSHDIPGVRRHHVPVYKDGEYSPISMASKFNGQQVSSDGPQAKRSEDGFIEAYEDILKCGATSGSFQAIMLHILEKPGEPLFWHCTLGKDRTGIFAALLLKLCGVGEDDIVNDYALTTQGLGKWREYLVRRLMDGAGGEYSQDSPQDGSRKAKRPPTRAEAERIVGSHAEDMRLFLKMLQQKYGGGRRYFTDLCGLTDVQLDGIVKNLVVES